MHLQGQHHAGRIEPPRDQEVRCGAHPLGRSELQLSDPTAGGGFVELCVHYGCQSCSKRVISPPSTVIMNGKGTKP